ncbi:MAG: phosphomethylpyrimidine synthase ThiC [Methanophagales archaeon]|nr:phosphomethylpyrimidine synthase ThiC [Methanophagales archaeon]RLG31857.1 MAG: phosphomethylpyrimidine synthase [Methanosarcinales archaeon]
MSTNSITAKQEEKEIEKVSLAEGLSLERLKRGLESGRVVIPRNVKRAEETKDRAIALKAIGEGVSTKVNVNVGTSKDYVNLGEEVEKAKVAVKYGADTIMDLSTGGDLDEIRKAILKEVDVPVGTVPIYQAALEKTGERAVVEMSADDMFNAVRKHAKDGIDFVTIHAGVNLNSLERLRRSERILDVVSRGGAFLVAWMIHNEQENPFYKEYDYLLEIAKEYDLTLSLGDGMRPGCISDASDRAKYMETIVLGELVEQARKEGVQAMVEGPGHVPLNEIEASVKTIKHITNFAPLYLLGPLVTDIAPGYDHFVSAIGGAMAGMYGADFLCMVSPSEHLALPSVNDIKEGTIVTKIAAHAADLVKEGQRERARLLDDEMAYARRNLNWKRQLEIAINPEEARRIRNSRPSESEACSICGDLCAIKMVKEFLKK